MIAIASNRACPGGSTTQSVTTPAPTPTPTPVPAAPTEPPSSSPNPSTPTPPAGPRESLTAANAEDEDDHEDEVPTTNKQPVRKAAATGRGKQNTGAAGTRGKKKGVKH